MNCEIEFLPVGQASKGGDAIVVRWDGQPGYFYLMIIDGGDLESGKSLVKHIRDEYGQNCIVAHVVVTHCDADHISGLREVLTELDVRSLWIHLPWNSAAASLPYFANKNWTVSGLQTTLRGEYDLVTELVQIAQKRNIPVYEPFAGQKIGPFTVLSPNREIYALLLPQFDRTPDPDEDALKEAGLWIGKSPNIFQRLIDKAAAKVQKWTTERWEKELLRDDGCTSASNESSVILYGDFGLHRRVLWTGDAGNWGLSLAANFADSQSLPLRDFMFVQIPHHGSRSNVGPTILNYLVGPILAPNTSGRFSAFVSAPALDDSHPRKMVLNAFIRRGATVCATQGNKKVFWGGFTPRAGYINAESLPFASQVEEYD